VSFWRTLLGRNWQSFQKRGDRYFEAKDWGMARGEYLEALNLFEPGSPEDEVAKVTLRERLGIVHHHLTEMHLKLASEATGDNKRALDHLRSALEFSPEGRKEEITGKIAALEKRAIAPKVAPKVAKAVVEAPLPRENNATQEDEVFLVMLSDMDEAQADLYEGLGQEFRRGYLALQQGKLDEADALLTPLCEARKDEPFLRFELGRLRLAQGRHADADVLFGEAAPKLPQNLPVRYAWIEALWGLKDWPRAERLVEELFALKDNLPEHYRLAGETCLRSGELDNGVELLEAGLESHGRELALWKLLGKLQMARKNVRGALDAFETDLKIYWQFDPQSGTVRFDHEAAFLAGTIYLQNKMNLPRAEELFKALVKGGHPNDQPHFLVMLGQALQAQGNKKEAFRVYSDAVGRFPDGSMERGRLQQLLADTST
jgi:tetratricopeptide (TPR) repeat protein